MCATHVAYIMLTRVRNNRERLFPSLAQWPGDGVQSQYERLQWPNVVYNIGNCVCRSVAHSRLCIVTIHTSPCDVLCKIVYYRS